MIRFLSLILAVFLLAGVAGAQTPRPADEVFQLTAKRGDDGAVFLDWHIAEGTYLYRDSLKVQNGDAPIDVSLPEGEEKDDPNFGRVHVFHDQVEGELPPQPDFGQLTVVYQGCAEQGICYPPVKKTLDLSSLAVSGINARSGGNRLTASPWKSAPDITSTPAKPVAASTNDVAASPAPATPDRAEQAASYLNGNPALMLIGFLGFGLLLSFTPCVLPMIPILSATLAGAGEKLSAGRGFVLSCAYVLAMAAAYGVVGLFAGWSGANLQAALQTPWALGFSAVVFTFLALGMFGVFEFQLPSRITTWLSGRGRGGSIAGASVLGFGSALIIGPCVTPPLAAAMLYAINTGEAVKGALALFALGLGMGLPLIAFGTFGARILPKSGPWLVAVRQAFGVVFLGVAVFLVARLLPPVASLALWGASAVGLSVYAGAFDRLSRKSGWVERTSKATGLLAFVAGVVMLVGASAGESDPLRPLAFLANHPASESVRKVAETRVSTPAAFETALASASAPGKPVLVSFTADWCTICKSNEKIMAESGIAVRLAQVPVIEVDVTRQNSDTETLMRQFSVVGPPTLFLVDASGKELGGSRITGAITTKTIAQKLSQAGA
ncbi:protein-disulfide reductase DsbD [Martelella mediterranea]|uniref:Thiol:disulfide interchange protein DsbD n=1 Tax=Martelella mediterranea TaxID=293089 RepID=A0A4R3NK63_9HYPH|nr:protein-disulfide reductase DsbD [Martelella mediterranea]TCT34730.1 thiol:disulfide interchange protein DsbD [Martelella mediterranea]